VTGPFGSGGFGSPGRPRPPRPPQLPTLPTLSRRAKIGLVVLAALIVVIILFNVFVGQYTDLLWYDSVHFSSVWKRRLAVEVVMFFVALFVVGGFAVGNVLIAYRLRSRRGASAGTAAGPPGEGMAAWHSVARGVGIVGLVVLFLVVGIPSGVAAAKRWQLWMLWSNSTPFGVRDPQFHRDISYFAFSYPLERFVLNELFAAVTIAIVAVAVTTYLFGGLRLNLPRVHSTPAARAHLSVLVGLFVLLKAAAYWLDRYGLAFSPRGNVTGPSYSDVHATLPAKSILVFIALICAVLFFANVRQRNLMLPALAFGLMAVSAILIGGAYPALVQHFKVAPSAQDLEAKYIGRNIAATRSAFGIASVQPQDYAGVAGPNTSVQQVRTDVNTRAQLRLIDPNIVTRTFNQLQQQRSFYSFSNPLDVDRYSLTGSGELQDVIIGTRNISLAGLQSGQQNWINQHLVYTHGFGAVAALGDQVGTKGNPDFIESELPPKGFLSSQTQWRVYFGEGEPNFSIVGAPASSRPRELDYPQENSAGQTNYTYQGNGGVPIGSFWRRLLYAWKLRDKNVLLSSGVNADSRILYVRDPRSRVAKVAPWLTLDSDAYPTVVGNQIDWVVDGYTTSNGYPYSEQESLATDTATTLTTGESTSAQGSGTINYIRNSVKAVVNAYTGAVTLYEWTPGEPAGGDPVLKTWEKAFPGVVHPYSAIPPAVMQHFRYPEDLFNIQRALLARYHVLDPKAFYNGTNFWKVPDDPTLPNGVVLTQPAYYLTISPDGSSTPVFSLTSTFTQTAGRNLTAFMSVNSQPGDGYGKFTLLQLPTTATFDGPGQVQNQDIESYTPISTLLSLLRRGGSRVELGNLLTVPVDGALLYVEPVYVEAAGGTSFPVLRRVVAVYNGTTGFSPTLAGALNQAFAVSGPSQPSQPTQPSNGGQGPGGQGSKPPKQRTTGASAKVQADLNQALRYQQQAEQDLRAGNFAAYGRDEKKLAAALAAAQRDAG
jgi:uncharacterized membrane protein (UPF0182 family)